MLGIGMGEMIIIGIIALIVIGPEKFPDFAKIALRTMRDLRGYVDEIQGEVTKEFKPIKSELNKLSRDSKSYIDKISKETETAYNTPPVPVSAPVTSQADPTDRQDDGQPASDPYGLNKTAEEPAGEAAGDRQPDGAAQQAETPVQDAAAGEGADRDGFDTPGPPVERLD